MGSESKGPFAYENWKMAQSGAPVQRIVEYPLFTDAHIVGEARDKYGPYQLLNILPLPPDAQLLLPVLVLRSESYLVYDIDMSKTDTARYHGGFLSDEIAAIVSLCLGIKIKAGGESRRFHPNGDPKGRPVGPRIDENPVIAKLAGRNLILPRTLGMHSLSEMELFGRFTDLTPQQAIALIRAARLYQDAVWIAESEPELSWIMLVSSVEIAAGHWHQDGGDRYVELLAESKPDFVVQLEKVAGKEAVSLVAGEFASLLGAAKKFRDFMDEFKPDPPDERPHEFEQFHWTRREIKQAMVKIYDYRSRALHDGTPFPMPMCQPPRGLSEIPPGLATGGYGGVWQAEDTPMLLQTFEYIVRNALIKWWARMLPEVRT
jgi:hypothetical protein